MVHIPWLWNRFIDATAKGPSVPHERAHGDGIEVTAESPEAFVEVLWQTFFPHVHDPETSNVLGRNVSNPELDRKSTRLNSSPLMRISYAVFCLKNKTTK